MKILTSQRASLARAELVPAPDVFEEAPCRFLVPMQVSDPLLMLRGRACAVRECHSPDHCGNSGAFQHGLKRREDFEHTAPRLESLTERSCCAIRSSGVLRT